MQRQGQRPPAAARVARMQVRRRLFGKARECRQSEWPESARSWARGLTMEQRSVRGMTVKLMRAFTRRQVKGTIPAQSIASTVWSGSDGGTATVVGTCGADAGAVVDESAEKDAGPRRMWNRPRHKDPWWRCCRPAPEFPQYGPDVRSRQCRGSRGTCTLPEIHGPPNKFKAVVFSALRECRKIELAPIEFSLESLAG